MANSQRSMVVQLVLAIIVAVLVITAGVVTIVQSQRAIEATEQNRLVIQGLQDQTNTILCVLLIPPADRTAENVDACRESP